jgi:hypothetical protein
MLLKYIAVYNHYLWLLLAGTVIFKILLSFFFDPTLEGIFGFVRAVFKWYGEPDQEMAETNNQRLSMRVQNVITAFMYLVLGVIVLTSLLPMFVKTTA